MTNLWAGWTVVGVGALHGLNPANGWLLAATQGTCSRDRAQALRALLPIGVGHVASVALVAGGVALDLSLDRTLLQSVAGAVLLVAAAVHLWRRAVPRVRAKAGHATLALCSFMMSTAHGAGLMLVPALVPLCQGDGATRHLGASGPLLLSLATVGAHGAAMLAVTGALATGVCRGVEATRLSAWPLGQRKPPASAARWPPRRT